ncbi:ABC transporter ATP-binding protein [Intrasporangium sp.]|uniref:ABC transporter ATP-binding protein n=1 Tax=Intrasporangium sp. TaxID=1925024 RepID=UPI002939A194|nr:ABC transporter ATP-binding protein [Intrasporangium sp.]MDV3220874.1 ABC transporter ATP-binding protein [Intrasporangium sp.]
MRELPPTDVEATGLSMAYAGRTVVDDVSFLAPAGSVTALLGGNGAGKSTTFRLVLGLARGKGNARFGGRPLAEHPSPSAVVGAYLGPPAFSEGRTVLDHLRLIALATRQSRSRIDRVIDDLGLAPWATSRPKGFSTGMRQRLGIAAAVLASPRVLVMDEPINGLDPHAVIGMRDLLRDHARDGGTVVMASHVLTEVELVADRALVMADGRLVRSGSVAELLARDDASACVVECDRPEDLTACVLRAGATSVSSTAGSTVIVEGLDPRILARIAADARILVWRLQPRTRTLEDVFLDTVGPRSRAIAPLDPAHQETADAAP